MRPDRLEGANPLRLPAEAAGEITVRGIERRRERERGETDARVASAIERVAPVSHWKLLGHIRTV